MFKKLIKKVIWNLKGGYRPKIFWDKWASSFMDDNWQQEIHRQHEWILTKIKKSRPKEILEVGCGFGRNIRFLIDRGLEASNITGVDISEKMIKNAKKYIGNNDVKLMTGDILRLPFDGKTFDLILVHGVLMHVKPKDIDKAIEELIRVAKEGIIGVEQNHLEKGKHENLYTFIHNYKQLYFKKNAKIKEFVSNKRGKLDYYYVEVR